LTAKTQKVRRPRVYSIKSLASLEKVTSQEDVLHLTSDLKVFK